MLPARLLKPLLRTLNEPSLLMARRSGPLYCCVSPGSKEGVVAGFIAIYLRLSTVVRGPAVTGGQARKEETKHGWIQGFCTTRKRCGSRGRRYYRRGFR